MRCCEKEENVERLRDYDPRPRNPDGSIRWYLYRWDDGKDGCRHLARCRRCGALYLVQAYRLNKFSDQWNTLFEDWYFVEGVEQAEEWNLLYTGPQLERRETPVFRREVPLV